MKTQYVRITAVMLALLALALVFTAKPAHAASKSWVPTTGGVWTDGANWSDGIAPANGDAVTIPGDQSGAITDIPTRTLASLTANGSATLYTAAGQSLGATSISVASGKTLEIAGIISGGSLSKGGLGTLVLSGTNTYTGQTTVTGGVLSVSVIDNAPSPGNIGMGYALALAGGTLQYTGSTATINRGPTFQANSTIEVTNAATVLTIQAQITGSYGFTKTGPGKLVFANTDPVYNTYTGTTKISEGVLSVAKIGLTTDTSGWNLGKTNGITLDGGTLQFIGSPTISTDTTNRPISVVAGKTSYIDVASGKSLVISSTPTNGVLSGTGTLVKTGPGGLTLGVPTTGAYANVNFTGELRIDAGSFLYGAANMLANTARVTVNGGTWSLSSYPDQVGAVKLMSGTLSGAYAGMLQASSYEVQNGTVSARLGGAVGLTKTTPGVVTMSGSNTFSGSTTIQDGVLSVTSIAGSGFEQPLGPAMNVILSGGTLQYTGGSTTLTSRTFTLTPGTTSTIEVKKDASTTLTLLGAGATISGGGSLITKGPGNLTYAGNLTIPDLTVNGNLNSSGTLNVAGNLTVNGTFASTGTVQLNGTGPQTVGGTGSWTLNNLIVNNTSGGSGAGPEKAPEATNAGGVTFNTDVTVNGVLTLNGDITMGNGFTLTQTGTCAGTGDVIGSVKRADLGPTEKCFGNPHNEVSIDEGTVPDNTLTVTLVKSAPADFPSSILRTYALSPDLDQISATVCLHYLDADLNGLAESNLNVWHQVAGTWTSLGRSASDTAEGWVEQSGVTSFSPFTLGGNNTPTAAALLSFTAKLTPTNTARVAWETGSEMSLAGFNVYRQVKGAQAWKKLNAMLIPAKNPGGVSGAKYTLNDKQVKPGKTYRYKLEWLDTDGTSMWSKVARVQVP